MIESRCGIKCSECKYKDELSCSGCVNIDDPFWGECQVKDCCEDKKLENCGFCKKFPCDLLNKFSYDKKEGDNGKRIEQCKTWCSDCKK